MFRSPKLSPDYLFSVKAFQLFTEITLSDTYLQIFVCQFLRSVHSNYKIHYRKQAVRKRCQENTKIGHAIQIVSVRFNCI